MENYFEMYKKLVFYTALALLFKQFVYPDGLREKLMHGREMAPRWLGPFSYGDFFAYLVRCATMPLALGFWPGEKLMDFFGGHTYLVLPLLLAWYSSTWWIARRLDDIRCGL